MPSETQLRNAKKWLEEHDGPDSAFYANGAVVSILMLRRLRTMKEYANTIDAHHIRARRCIEYLESFFLGLESYPDLKEKGD